MNLRIFLAAPPGNGSTLLCDLLLEQHGPDLRVLDYDLDLDQDNPPTRCIVRFSGQPDASLIIRLRKQGFKFLTLFQHPLDTLLASVTDDCLHPSSLTFADQVVCDAARTVLLRSLEWACMEDCLVVRHEDLVYEPAQTITHIARHLMGPDYPVAATHTASQVSCSECDEPGRWIELFPAATVHAAHDFHRDIFACMDYPEPSHNLTKTDAHTPPQIDPAKGPIDDDPLLARENLRLRRKLNAAEDRNRQLQKQLKALLVSSRQAIDRIQPIPEPLLRMEAEFNRLHRLLYGASVGQHLYRAWQVLRGNKHYCQKPPQGRSSQSAPENPSRISGYHDLFIDGLHMRFHKAALADLRGMGRVARELLHHFQKFASADSTQPKASSLPPVHFFAAPHWGPDPLPPRSCVLIHDVIPMVMPNYPADLRTAFENRCNQILPQAALIITCSETSARDIPLHLPQPGCTISVIHNGVTLLPVSTLPQVKLPASPYIVFLGSIDSHKNIEVVVKALQRPAAQRIHLVMIGRNEAYRSTVQHLGMEDRVHFLGSLEDAEVGYVIKNAVALVFPSYYEGFGLPPLEAALLGVPSVCSRRPAMTELLADATLFADPDSPDEWAQCIGTLAASPAFAHRIGSAARERAEQFQWSTTARAYVQALQSLSAAHVLMPA
ncbi:MAG: glycosyltransferase family 1 protein [Opitutaceae bacterium]|jgi:glycosyltransferase involved in cell wall biosynthesis